MFIKNNSNINFINDLYYIQPQKVIDSGAPLNLVSKDYLQKSGAKSTERISYLSLCQVQARNMLTPAHCEEN
jgi:hypothetical protein